MRHAMFAKGAVMQLVRIVQGLTGPHRLAVITVASLSLLLPTVMVWTSSVPRYRVLVRGIRPKSDVQAITCELEKRGVVYQLSEGGRTVSVPEEKHTEALDHLNRESLITRHQDQSLRDFVEKQPSIGLYPEIQKMQRLRLLEMDIARTIAMYDSVEYARVHITEPRETFFKNDATPVTASVFVDVAPGKQLSSDQVMTIKALVSHAVEGLSPMNITLCDSSGSDYSRPATRVVSAPVTPSLARELEFARLAEAILEEKVSEHLLRLFGPEAFAASVTVEMETTQSHVDAALAGPASGAMVCELVTENGGRKDSGGNAAGPIPGRSTRARGIETHARVRRLSVSILVDSRSLPDGKLSGSLQAVLQEDVKAAVGFSTTRGDSLSILAAPFHRSVSQGVRVHPSAGPVESPPTNRVRTEGVLLASVSAKNVGAAAGWAERSKRSACVVAGHFPRETDGGLPAPSAKKIPHPGAAAGAVSLVISNFQAFWAGQIIVLVFVLGVLVRHMGGPPGSSLLGPERLYPVRLDQILSVRPIRKIPVPPLESYVGRQECDLSGALAGTDASSLVLVLRTATDPVRQMILSQLTPERSKEVAAMLATQGPVPLARVEEARRRLTELLAGSPAKRGRIA